MGNTYTVVWKTGCTIVHTKATNNLFTALYWLFFFNPPKQYHWKSLDVR